MQDGLEAHTSLTSSIASRADAARKAINERLVAADAVHVQRPAATEGGSHAALGAGGQARDLGAGERGQEGEGGECEFVHCRVVEISCAAVLLYVVLGIARVEDVGWGEL